jgi:hypothetical protein
MDKAILNKDKSADIFQRQVAAWAWDTFCCFCLTKNHKISNNTKTTEAREKGTDRFEVLRILEKFGCRIH